MLETMNLRSSKRIEMIDITAQVNEIISKSGIASGICVINVPHTTSAITVNENADIDTTYDIIDKTSRLVPHDDSYAHIEGNSDAHIKTSLFGQSITLIVHDSRLLMGTWQSLFFCEFDGPRARKIFIKIIKD
jgi:secondary thiamine-phosphate synthase enzyme